jgi:hypothetical protein
LIDLYLSDQYNHHWPKIRELALSDKPEAFEKLKKYALEGYELSSSPVLVCEIVSHRSPTVSVSPHRPSAWFEARPQTKYLLRMAPTSSPSRKAPPSSRTL